MAVGLARRCPACLATTGRPGSTPISKHFCWFGFFSFGCPWIQILLKRSFARGSKGWPAQGVDDYALRLLREELAMDLDLPSLEDCRGQLQAQLF